MDDTEDFFSLTDDSSDGSTTTQTQSSNSGSNRSLSQGFLDLTKTLGTAYLSTTAQNNQSATNGLLTAANAQATAAQNNAALITKVMLGLGAAVLVIGVIYTLKSK